MMETVCYQLIPLWCNALDHLTGPMYNKQHKKGLHFTEFGKLLQDRLIVAVGNIFRKLIPNKEDAGSGQAIALNDRSNPLFERI